MEDNGIGMRKNELERLFDPYFTTKATSVKGRGMGLFVIQKMVKKYGGEITVSSEYGRGTTFTILFPLWKEGRR